MKSTSYRGPTRLEIRYPADLPVVERREAILSALEAHQVIIVCGETGSGKTTQLPKICLEAGLGVSGYIGHTQPRRIAARSVVWLRVSLRNWGQKSVNWLGIGFDLVIVWVNTH